MRHLSQARPKRPSHHRTSTQLGRLAPVAAAVASLLVASAARADKDWADNDKHGGKGYFAIGWSALDLDRLNKSIASSGYPSFSEDFLTLGGGGYAILGRFVIGGQGHGYLAQGRDVAIGTENFRADVKAGAGFVDLGWVVWADRGCALTPLVGLGGGGLVTQIDALAAPTFDDVLAQPGHRSTLSTSSFLIDLGASFDVIVEGGGHNGGPLLGVRVGWILAPVHGGWRLEGRDIAGGPDLGITGPYVRVLLGGGSMD